jgi:Na+/H+ antiporter
MSETGIQEAQLLLLFLLLCIAVFAALARKVGTPYPIVLVMAGLVIGFIPGIPAVRLNPDLIFLVVLPPLLYSAAWITSWRDLSRNLVSIVMLAFGLVGFTVWAVAGAGPWLFRGFDWRIGLVLGATVATTDAIAATSIARRLGLPRNIVDLLEGESLINDATGLLALEFATSIVVDGQRPTVGSSFLHLIYLGVAGIGIGLILARIVEWLVRRLDDGPIEIAVSILVPYAAALTAEAVHASGVLAVVAAGLYLGRKSSEVLSPAVRIQRRAVWESLTFILNGFVFVLIGLQLPGVMAGVGELSRPKVILYGVVFSGFLILLRLVWTFPGAYVAHFVRTRLLRQDVPVPEVRGIFVIGWTGMRGVIALAAAMSLPQTIADGSPFPQRDLIIFLTFAVILVTLVFQGLTLPALIRFLGFAGVTGPTYEEQQARRLVLEAALAKLEEFRQGEPSQRDELYDHLARQYKHRMASVGDDMEQDGALAEQYVRYLDLSRSLRDAERQTALRLRNEGRISDDLLREIEHELDLNETRLFNAAHGHSDVAA